MIYPNQGSPRSISLPLPSLFLSLSRRLFTARPWGSTSLLVHVQETKKEDSSTPLAPLCESIAPATRERRIVDSSLGRSPSKTAQSHRRNIRPPSLALLRSASLHCRKSPAPSPPHSRWSSLDRPSQRVRRERMKASSLAVLHLWFDPAHHTKLNPVLGRALAEPEEQRRRKLKVKGAPSPLIFPFWLSFYFPLSLVINN